MPYPSADQPTLELPATSPSPSTPPPPPPPPPGRGRARRWRPGTVALGIAFVLALVAAGWQAATAADARSQATELEARVEALEDELDELRADNERLTADNEALRDRVEAGSRGGGDAGQDGRSDASGPQDALRDLIVPFLRDQFDAEVPGDLGAFGDLFERELESLADELDRALGDLLGR